MTIVSNTIPYDVRKYQEFCNVFNLKQLISCPTRITCSSSTIIDHILASYPDRVSQKGIIDIGISNHQFIFCTRKTLKTETASHKQISFRALKNYPAVTYEEALKKVKFPNYENFININEAYSNFIQKLTSVIDEIAPGKTKRVKGNSKERFDSAVSEGTNNRDKLFKKFKKSRLPLDQENYKKARYEVKKLIAEKKRNYFEAKLTENIGKPKELWKTLKVLGLPCKVSIATINALKEDKVVQYDRKSISKVFQRFFTNMAKTLLQKLPPPPNKYGIDSVKTFYKNLNTTKFQLKPTTEDIVLKLLKNIDISKAAGVNNLPGRFLKHDAIILAKTVTEICNLSIKSKIFFDPCKLAKLKPIFKKG